MAVNSDGRSVYAIGDRRLAVLNRDPDSGALVLAECFIVPGRRDPLGDPPCADLAALRYADEHLVASGDGRSVYAAGSGRLIAFDRDPADGRLSLAQCLARSDNEFVVCQGSRRLSAPLAISGDGRFVYAGGVHGLLRFRRDRATSHLTLAQCLFGGSDERRRQRVGMRRCKGGRAPMPSTTGIAVNYDGTSVYVTSFANLVVHLRGRPRTGWLSFSGCTEGSANPNLAPTIIQERAICRNIPTLAWPLAPVLSPDGRSLYVSSEEALIRFNRARRSGRLRFVQCFGTKPGPAVRSCARRDAFTGSASLTLSGDGRSLYSAGGALLNLPFQASIVLFERRRTSD